MKKTFHQVQQELQGRSILVANRGIVARRVCRSLRESFGCTAVMAASHLDRHSPAIASADRLLLLEEDNYLDIESIVKKAQQQGIIALHPGWGFASENPDYPRICKEHGVLFIGPEEEAMRSLGSKLEARNLAKSLNIPTVPGSDKALSLEEAKKMIEIIGLPVLIKAEGGGGGRGMAIVEDAAQLEKSFMNATTQAASAFSNANVYIEKFLSQLHHLEIQVIADRHGNLIALDERDCSLQRNHQKLIEITPSPWSKVTPQLRETLKEYSVQLLKKVGYHSLATVEFLVDEQGAAYFIEVNTRLQVEHGISEARYGIDLVEEQIAIAFGAELRYTQEELKPHHWALQARINCEDPGDHFSPSAGLIRRYLSPGGPGVRIDSNLASGYDFPAQYDSTGALLILYAPSWLKVLAILHRSLKEYHISGIKTTIPFYKRLLEQPLFKEGGITTNFLSNNPQLLSYVEYEDSAHRTAQLIAEISVHGYNPYVKLGHYRSRDTPRLGNHQIALPPLQNSSSPAYPLGDRQALLDRVRDSGVCHFSDTTCRDMTQSNSGNRFRLADDKMIGPYLDRCGFFSLETGGGAHFHVALLANMTSPWQEAKVWNEFAPRTPKQILLRANNLLGYKPQNKKLLQLTCEQVCQEFHIIRCFDFLNNAESMSPLAEVILNRSDVVFEPAIALSYGEGYTIGYYLQVCQSILDVCARSLNCSQKEATKNIILGLKDMAGVCPPFFISELVTQLRTIYPDLILHYHRHATDGLFTPSVCAAVTAGLHIVDAALGAGVRSYGQGDVSATAALLRERGIKHQLDLAQIEQANFVLKQLLPPYDRYAAPYFQGSDYSVLGHALPGGATSSSQQGAVEQGYILLLPHILDFIKRSRKLLRYHDVTPGSQITWNTAFLAVTAAWKRGRMPEVERLLALMDTVITTPEDKLDEQTKVNRLSIYADVNDAFRDLLLGKYGPLPFGFPADWIYESAFTDHYKEALAQRSEQVSNPADTDLNLEKQQLEQQMNRQVSHEELLLYLNHPNDTVRCLKLIERFGEVNNIPTSVWFEGLDVNDELQFEDAQGRIHHMKLLLISPQEEPSSFLVRYQLGHEIVDLNIKSQDKTPQQLADIAMADPENIYHIGSPCNGDLWLLRLKPGDIVRSQQEICSISVMKQEKSIVAPCDAMVKRVLKSADYQKNKRMVAVREGEFLVELEPMGNLCVNQTCQKPLSAEQSFCPHCGYKQER